MQINEGFYIHRNRYMKYVPVIRILPKLNQRDDVIIIKCFLLLAMFFFT